MKCVNCGNEIPENSVFCPFCGKATVTNEELAVSINPVQEKLLNIFKDKLFLVLCILVSASIVLSFAAEGFPLLLILYTIFLWIIYNKAQKNTIDIKNMRNVSGTIFASYVITWVVIGLLAFVSIIGLAALLIAGNVIDINALLNEILSEVNASVYGIDILTGLTGSAIMIALTVVLVIFLIVCIIAAVINIFAMRNIHKFAKSLYKSAQSGVFALQKVNTTINWLLVFGIFSGISAITSIGDLEYLASNGCIAATYIIAYILIKKHFKQEPTYNI